MVLLIAYDLPSEHPAYADVISLIKTAGAWAHLEKSVWLVDTTETASTWRDELGAVAAHAMVFVVVLKKSWASRQIDVAVAEWLKAPERRWS